MKKLILGLFIFGLTSPLFAQINDNVQELSEVTVVATNYKYLSQANSREAAVPVKMLQEKVANFDLKSSPYYRDDYDFYDITFFIPEGKILAAYDRDGKVLRTVERYENSALPREVITAVTKRFPGWTIAKDIYLVNYHETKGMKKRYKLRLENGDKTMWVKTDEKGNYI
ncbi:MAG: nicotinate-nucleotide adenylyltransferase [Salegentibacter sp.]